MLTLLLLIAGTWHDLHLSKTILHYNAGKQSFEISIHIFIDDLENAILLDGSSPLYLETSKETENAEEKLIAYIQRSFQLFIDGKSVNLNFIGREPSTDVLAIWCYFEVSDVQEEPGEFWVENKLLLDLFEDQKNLMNITGPGLQEYHLLDSEEPVARIKLK